jgi:hypothetical protein
MKKLLTVLLLIFLATVGFSQTVDGVKKATIEGTTYVKSPKLVLDRSATTTTETIKNIGGVLYWGNAPLFTTSTLDTSFIAFTNQQNTFERKQIIDGGLIIRSYNDDILFSAFSTKPSGVSESIYIGGGGQLSVIGSGLGGTWNTSLGRYSLLNNTSGAWNTAIGKDALKSNTTGVENTSVGENTLTANTIGRSNTVLGVDAFHENQTGNYNIAIGLNAGAQSYIGGDPTNNENSIFIGHNAYPYTGGGSGEIVIGNDIHGNGNNTTTIGGSEIYLRKTFITANYDDALQVTGNAVISGKLTVKSASTVVTKDSTLYIEDGEVKRGLTPSYVLGSGTINTLPKFTATSTLGNSLITEVATGNYIAGKLGILDSLNVGKRIFAKNLSTIVSLDTVIRYNKLTGELMASPDHFTFFDNTLSTGNNVLTSGTFTAGGGTDYVQITAQNAVRLEGTASVWDDLLGPFNSGLSGGSAYPTFVVDSNYYTFNIDTTGPSICKQYFEIQMPHTWKQYSTIFPHVHYVHTAGQGTPTFIIKYRWTDTGQKPGRYTWLRLTLTTGTTDGTVQMNYSSTGISGAGKTISSILDMQVYLLSTTGGTKTCFGKSYDVHYQIDALGSNDETSKN